MGEPDPLAQAWDDLAADLEHRPHLPQHMTLQQVADYVQVHPTTVRTWARTGQLPGTKVGPNGLWRFTRNAVLEFMGHHPLPDCSPGCGCTGHLPDAAPSAVPPPT